MQTGWHSERHREAQIEKRKNPRIYGDYFVLVRGASCQGHRFEETAHLTNLSAHGCFIHIKHCVSPGEKVFMMIRLKDGVGRAGVAPKFAATGKVLRIQTVGEGIYGIAVSIDQHRFL